jgi:hypothetical protein
MPDRNRSVIRIARDGFAGRTSTVQIPAVIDAPLAPLRPILRAIAETVIPDPAKLDARSWDDVERTVATALARRPAGMRRQFSIFLRVIEWLPLLRFGRRFSALDVARRTRVLTALERSPLLLLRRGFWGLRTLLYMGVYTREEIAAALGYRADPRGWAARR